MILVILVTRNGYDKSKDYEHKKWMLFVSCLHSYMHTNGCLDHMARVCSYQPQGALGLFLPVNKES